MWMTVQMKWCDFVCIIASAPLKIVAADVKKWVLCVFVCFSWSRSEALRVSAASLFSADLWRLSRTALPAQLLLSKGGAGELDAGRVRGHRGGSDQHRERAGRTLQPQQRPEPQQSTLGRRKALRLQSNTWRSWSRAAVPQELRVLMFLQWRAAGFTAVTWFTAQYSSSLSICCHCCSFNKASERLTFVFDCIIDQCVLPSLKFQLRTAAFSSKCELKLLGFEHGLWRRSCSILRRSESLKLSMQIWFHLQLTVSLFDRFNVWTGSVSLLIMGWWDSYEVWVIVSWKVMYIIVQFTKQNKKNYNTGTEKIVVFFCFFDINLY